MAVPGGPAAAKPKVNLNTATAKEIADNVPGIGQKLAEEIVKYRQDKGPFNSVDELGKVPGMGPARLTRALAFVTTEAPPPPPTLTQVQTSLAQRQVAILERSDRTGVTDATIEAIRKIRPLARATDKSLAEAERLIAQAEKVGGKKIDAAAKRALDATTKRAGKEGMATARGDELARLTDTQVGEALLAVKGLRNLGPAELRGVIHAYRARLDLTGFLAVAKGMPTAERNFALDTYGRLKDARVEGADRILADMGRGRGAWDGGMWALEAARFDFGIENIAGFEVKVEGQGVRRDYDIVLKKEPAKIELKNWATWDDDMGAKIGSQFIRDVILGLNDPAVFKTHRYVFRAPAPRSAEQIKSFLRGELQRHLNSEVAAGRMTGDRRQAVLDAFDAETGLVVISNARRAGSAPQPAPEPPPKVPPVPRVPDEEEKKKLDRLPLRRRRPTSRCRSLCRPRWSRCSSSRASSRDDRAAARGPTQALEHRWRVRLAEAGPRLGALGEGLVLADASGRAAEVDPAEPEPATLAPWRVHGLPAGGFRPAHASDPVLVTDDGEAGRWSPGAGFRRTWTTGLPASAVDAFGLPDERLLASSSSWPGGLRLVDERRGEVVWTLATTMPYALAVDDVAVSVPAGR